MCTPSVRAASWSDASNTVTATLLADIDLAGQSRSFRPPAVVPTHVDLAWSYTDNDPNPRFDIYVNAVSSGMGRSPGRTKRIVFLNPGTTYTFMVRARDSGGQLVGDERTVRGHNAGGRSDRPRAADDAAGLLGRDHRRRHGGDVLLGQLCGQRNPAGAHPVYGYLNGQFDGATVDPYPHQFSMYLTLGIVNTIEVYAVDEAGNRSAPATMTIDLRNP